MAIISAFADEIDPSLDVQMDVCQLHGIRHIDVRSIDGVNVSKFTDEQARQYARRLADRGFAVPCVGSPLGKVAIDSDLDAHMELTRRCCQIAHILGAPYIRVFSFYPPQGGNILDHRQQVVDALGRMVQIAAAEKLVLLNENEKGIYGAKPEQMLDLHAAIPGPHFKSIFDPSNYIEEGVRPYEDGWQRGLDRITHYFHIKDKLQADGPTCVPAGEGSGSIDRILADAKAHGFDGYMTLEPHLQQAGQFAGFTGPDRFALAVAGLKKVCDKVGLKYA